jgi:hypothetical protein
MKETLYLRQMELGPMQNFVYLVGDPEAGACVVGLGEFLRAMGGGRIVLP